MGGGVLKEVFAKATVNPDLAARGMGALRLVEKGLAYGGVLDAGRGDQNGQQRPRMSVIMLRLRPTIFLPASAP